MYLCLQYFKFIPVGLYNNNASVMMHKKKLITNLTTIIKGSKVSKYRPLNKFITIEIKRLLIAKSILHVYVT